MQFKIIMSLTANKQLKELEESNSNIKVVKAVKKALAYLGSNPKHPALNTHEHTGFSREFGLKVFEAYAQNKTPGAYRIFWFYGPNKKEISIISIIPHP